MKVYDIELAQGEIVLLTEAPVSAIEVALLYGEVFDTDSPPTLADYDEQCRIIISLKKQGLLP